MKLIFQTVIMTLLTVSAYAQDSGTQTAEYRYVNRNGGYYVAKQEKPSAAFQLRTNILTDLALSPSIGLECQTNTGWAWQFDYAGAWWNSDNRHRYWSDYGFHTELRYYLRHDNLDSPYRGHHLGAYGWVLTYDFEFGGKGWQCANLANTFGFGLSYGYSLPLSRRWGMDFTIGIGYLQSRYTEYYPMFGKYIRTDDKKFNWTGPSKAEVSLVYNLNILNSK